jgi:hypothetical protein
MEQEEFTHVFVEELALSWTINLNIIWKVKMEGKVVSNEGSRVDNVPM